MHSDQKKTILNLPCLILKLKETSSRPITRQGDVSLVFFKNEYLTAI